MTKITKKRRIRAGHKEVVTKSLGEVRALLEAGQTSEGNPDTLKLAQMKLNFKEKLGVLNSGVTGPGPTRASAQASTRNTNDIHFLMSNQRLADMSILSIERYLTIRQKLIF